MKDFMKRVTSRKFLLALAGFITGIANGEPALAIASILGYLASEGYIDGQRENNL